MWNRYNNDGDKTIEMYDIASQTFVSIKDPDGMSVSNPRMVLSMTHFIQMVMLLQKATMSCHKSL